ncbi:hypothetical protein GGI25_004580 [Coemansia spiralis]|uniref:Cyclin-like domain-containing protein n=2 Tax=Coemansia TaxID=4863 RepID=A0A9W8G3V8_9FUNG|nr:cyclin-like protein [Coemansia spiralis]KAJ1993552.1 hypothetical protein EDC05_002179 [Coemansia umbellata]KAJ2625205.1 hypothetical protein GGI26_000674 [Coemansia sp. RSA 1358]KAJ2673773.1 hypothetical protein GGI25_004580 [Coemansia spiralis]
MTVHLGLNGGYAAVSVADDRYPLFADASEQWYFTKEDLMNTPSQAGSDYSPPSGKTSYSPEEERSWRSRGCNFIHNVAKRLDVHQFVASTACVYFHRFYMRQSLGQYHAYEVASACVFLATKVEENKRSLKDVAFACAYVAVKGSAKEAAQTQDRWQRLIRRLEIIVLENCCFDLDITHPYSYLDTLAPEFGIPVFVAKSATAHVNDCLRSPLCLLYRPEIIAVAALYFAMGVHGYDFKGSLFDSCKVALPSGAGRETEACAMDMLEFYQRETEVEREALQRQHKLSPPFT